MRRFASSVMIGVLAACGGEAPETRADAGSDAPAAKPAGDVETCSLLTPDEIEGAVSWKPDAGTAETYGSTRTCTYKGPKPGDVVVLVVSKPGPKGVSSSTEFADWRKKQIERQPDLKLTITPIEGLGVPAVQSASEGGTSATVEATKNGLLLGVTAKDLEPAKTLASKAAARLP